MPPWSSPGPVFLDRIYDSTLNVSAASFDTGANGVPQTFSHLLLVSNLRDDGAVVASWVNMNFNNDSGANYDREQATFGGNTGSATGNSAQTTMTVAIHAGANASASVFGATMLMIPNYTSTTSFKSVTSISGVLATLGTTSTYQAGAFQGIWRSTAAITQIKLLPGNGSNFVAGSRVTIYGMS